LESDKKSGVGANGVGIFLSSPSSFITYTPYSSSFSSSSLSAKQTRTDARLLL
jgi:hypothetical protein